MSGPLAAAGESAGLGVGSPVCLGSAVTLPG